MKKIQILGTGCKKCNDLTANAQAAAQAVGVDVELEKVTQLNDIMAFGVMTTPGLVIDGKVISQGKLLSVEQIAAHLKH
ncbi:thioredoxin family protein [Pelovirga terrestris]|uniref:TM0996/MTH895 family glutaredoxin-like protein n=1 Tax=Pelovirga terrestris TaxID=2771352 RepID=A0A8J6QZ14_9BACT|nr:thioredoxin family protein [Pelovirga terrestris]MBD1401748.1 TM0996/MTH895 family glutaredoxin-like protein [Pelovirga terrestris]